MDSGGGFLLEGARSATMAGATSVPSHHAPSDATDDATSTAVEVRKLTQKQEVRLMNYLDDAFQQLSRNYAKRYTAPASSNVKTLSAYVVQIERLLAIIAAIPPVGPSAQLLINYLLRLTSEVCDGIQGYEIKENEDGQSVSTQLNEAVRTLNLLDRVWASVLRGQMVNMHGARKHVEEDSSEYGTMVFPTSKQHTNSNDDTEHDVHAGRYHTDDRPSTKRDSRQVVGSRGLATVGQTQRIRLRNVITLAKENLFSWMRTQLDAPLPPQIEMSEQEKERERRELIAVEGDIDQEDEQKEAEEHDDEEREIVLEDVDVDRDEAETEEQRHYDTLFSRTVDPDASDEENQEDEAQSKRQRSNQSIDADDVPNKRRHVDVGGETETLTEQETLAEPTEAESEATFAGTNGPASMSVMRWDVAFAHLFGKTLRCLSDIQEYYERKTSTDQANAENDATVLSKLKQ